MRIMINYPNYPLCEWEWPRTPYMNWLTARSNDVIVLYIFVCQFRILSCVLAVAEVGHRSLASVLCVYFVFWKREDKGRWLVTFVYNVRIKFTEIDNTVHVNLGPNLCTGSLHSRLVQNHEFSISQKLKSDEEKNLFKKEDTWHTLRALLYCIRKCMVLSRSLRAFAKKRLIYEYKLESVFYLFFILSEDVSFGDLNTT